jgi:hypothetical protein
MSESTAPSVEEEISPVIYELGKALYIAQQFEMNLLFLVSVLSAQDGKLNTKSFVAGLDTHAGRTLGNLARAFKSKLELPDGLEAFLHEGVEARNRVMHGFVMHNTEKFQTRNGRAELIEELRDTQHILNERLKFAATALDRVLRTFGGSLEAVRAKAEFNFESDQINATTRH